MNGQVFGLKSDVFFMLSVALSLVCDVTICLICFFDIGFSMQFFQLLFQNLPDSGPIAIFHIPLNLILRK